jgi:tetratricopeptide (TPR) repeat protein
LDLLVFALLTSPAVSQNAAPAKAAQKAAPAGPSVQQSNPPPGNAMALSLPQARDAVREAIAKTFVGTMKICFFPVCVTEELSPATDFRLSSQGLRFAKPVTVKNKLDPGKVSIDFKKTNGSYVEAFRVGHFSCSKGSCYGVRLLTRSESEEYGLGPLWPDEATAQVFADAFNRLLCVSLHYESEEDFVTFSAAAKAWRDNPAKPALTPEADRHNILAENAIQEKNLDSAIEHYESAIDLQPMWPPFWFNLGMIYAEKSDFAHAADRMKHYLALVPDAPDAQAARTKMIIWEDKATK